MFFRSNHKLRLAAGFAALAVIGGLFAAGCNSSGDSEASRDAAVLNAINILDKAGLHDMDTGINEDKEIPANARTTAQQLQAVTNITEWPDGLESRADALAAIFAELAAAVDGDNPDIAKAGEAAKKAHDAQHDFSHDVWEYLYEQGDVSTGAAGGGH